MIITIDGPAGSGKSTAARMLARRLKIAYLDTGATYRAATLAAIQAGADLRDPAALAQLVSTLEIGLHYQGDELAVTIGPQDVTRKIRSADVSDKSYYLARAPAVRAMLVDLQRRIGLKLVADYGGMVSEGRDQGSVVFPQADFKFYLDASPEVRARRRCDELQADGQQADYQQVLQAILLRDGRDRSRSVAPLVKPPGAVEIDTTDMSIAQVTDELARLIQEARS